MEKNYIPMRSDSNNRGAPVPLLPMPGHGYMIYIMYL